MDSKQLKIVSWNINGLKSITLPLNELLDSFQADIICFQETKTTREQLSEATALVEGYTSYFSFSKRRSGYSGVVTFCKDAIRPYSAEEGLSGLTCSEECTDIIGSYGDIKGVMDKSTLQSLDAEGRSVLTKHKLRLNGEKEVDLVVINVYCPRADPERPDRKEYKIRFYELCEAILESGSHVVIVGDINTRHKPIDCCEIEDKEKFCSEPSRIWLSDFLHDSDKQNKGKFVDSFRHFYPELENAFTCWSPIANARENNYGNRIDYIFVDSNLLEQSVTDCAILSEVLGSDHCPVAATLRCTAADPSPKWPSLCSKNWPEFSGKQLKLSNFVQRISKDICANDDSKKHKLPADSTSGNKKIKQSKLDFFLKASPNQKPQKTIIETQMEEPHVDEVEINDKTTVNAWKSLFKGPPPPPLCRGHQQPSVLRVSKKPGPNFKRQFYVCAKPAGVQTDPNSNCNFFQWVNDTKLK